MIKVEFFGLYRLNYGLKECSVEAASVKELFKKLYEMNPVYTVKELKNSIVFVNDVNFLKLKKYKTPLKDGDKVLIMSPASGG